MNKIVDILADASLHPHEEKLQNIISEDFRLKWNENVELLRYKAMFRKELISRLHATEEGYRALYGSKHIQNSLNLLRETEENVCDLMWNHVVFKSSLRKAIQSRASTHDSLTPWDMHNFEFVPKDSRFFQHAMLSAIYEGEVVGFCEIAMLSLPSREIPFCDEKENELAFAPTLVNLVVSQFHRKKGVGSRILATCERYLKTHWRSCNSLGLYVYRENTGAVRLYEKVGFFESGKCELNPEKLFMEKILA